MSLNINSNTYNKKIAQTKNLKQQAGKQNNQEASQSKEALRLDTALKALDNASASITPEMILSAELLLKQLDKNNDNICTTKELGTKGILMDKLGNNDGMVSASELATYLVIEESLNNMKTETPNTYKNEDKLSSKVSEKSEKFAPGGTIRLTANNEAILNINNKLTKVDATEVGNPQKEALKMLEANNLLTIKEQIQELYRLLFQLMTQQVSETKSGKESISEIIGKIMELTRSLPTIIPAEQNATN